MSALGQKQTFLTVASRILYDAVVKMVYENESEEKNEVTKIVLNLFDFGPDQDLKDLRTAMYIFGSRLFGFYMLANQLPLLQLGEVELPDQGPNDCIIEGILKSCENQGSGALNGQSDNMRLVATRKLFVAYKKEFENIKEGLGNGRNSTASYVRS